MLEMVETRMSEALSQQKQFKFLGDIIAEAIKRLAGHTRSPLRHA